LFTRAAIRLRPLSRVQRRRPMETARHSAEKSTDDEPEMERSVTPQRGSNDKKNVKTSKLHRPSPRERPNIAPPSRSSLPQAASHQKKRRFCEGADGLWRWLTVRRFHQLLSRTARHTLLSMFFFAGVLLYFSGGRDLFPSFFLRHVIRAQYRSRLTFLPGFSWHPR